MFVCINNDFIYIFKLSLDLAQEPLHFLFNFALCFSIFKMSHMNTRASVLRKVAENADLRQQEMNRAFVLMQYFGYLRRNPDTLQDTDFSGWEFWLNKLNRFKGNFVEAEMVKAFLVSGEYRQRFGP